MKKAKTNSQYKSKYYKPIIKSKAMPNVDEQTKYKDLKHYDREALLKWLIGGSGGLEWVTVSCPRNFVRKTDRTLPGKHAEHFQNNSLKLLPKEIEIANKPVGKMILA